MFNFASHSQALSSQFNGTSDGFTSWARTFSQRLDKIAETFAIIISIALKLHSTDPTFFLRNMRDACKTVYRLIHYPSCHFDISASSPGSHKALRVGEHTDFGLFTLLMAGGPGLQIQGVDGQWMSVEVDSSSEDKAMMVVNTGALLARWTNDRWRATPHRVIAENEDMASRSRYSIALFVNPHMDAVVEPLVLQHEEEDDVMLKKKYDAITAQEYFDMRVKESLSMKMQNNKHP